MSRTEDLVHPQLLRVQGEHDVPALTTCGAESSSESDIDALGGELALQ
ncbi:MAG TPA: hypothetical protein VF003_11880 [Pseudonocardiaceae bacterium]